MVVSIWVFNCADTVRKDPFVLRNIFDAHLDIQISPKYYFLAYLVSTLISKVLFLSIFGKLLYILYICFSCLITIKAFITVAFRTKRTLVLMINKDVLELLVRINSAHVTHCWSFIHANQSFY
jgi:hypothetical protein